MEENVLSIHKNELVIKIMRFTNLYQLHYMQNDRMSFLWLINMYYTKNKNVENKIIFTLSY